MLDIQALVDAMCAAGQQSRQGYHLTLGKLIAALELAPSDAAVVYDVGGSPGKPRSYRGYYEDLAFDPNGDAVSVEAFVKSCRSALGSVFTGYKGGDFAMTESTVLWSASYGTSSGRAIVGAEMAGDQFVLQTRKIED